jgi:ABC-type multidrug transport system fused ATPase/permease subunit
MVGLMVPIQEVLVHTKRFYDVYDVQPDIQDPVKPVKTGDLAGHVVYSGVSFGYEPDRPVLKDIDLDVPAGTQVAIVGETGGGKSTLMCLLPRFYDPQNGSITIDGVNVRDMSLHDLRSHIGMVMQIPFLFVGTIKENITGGRKGFGQNRVIAAAEAANAHEFIMALPDGYDTHVGEKGVTLSGGEQQRIALARIFLLDRPILILDEATSSVDQKTEALIQEALRRLVRGRTTFIIAHRLSTIQDVDVILVMQGGQIVEKGTHQELMEKGGYYYRLYHKTSESILQEE